MLVNFNAIIKFNVNWSFHLYEKVRFISDKCYILFYFFLLRFTVANAITSSSGEKPLLSEKL